MSKKNIETNEVEVVETEVQVEETKKGVLDKVKGLFTKENVKKAAKIGAGIAGAVGVAAVSFIGGKHFERNSANEIENDYYEDEVVELELLEENSEIE